MQIRNLLQKCRFREILQKYSGSRLDTWISGHLPWSNRRLSRHLPWMMVGIALLLVTLVGSFAGVNLMRNLYSNLDDSLRQDVEYLAQEKTLPGWKTILEKNVDPAERHHAKLSPSEPSPPPPRLLRTFYLLQQGNRVESLYIGHKFKLSALNEKQISQIMKHGENKPQTIDIDALGKYRIVVKTVAGTGDRKLIVATGQPLEPLQSVILRFLAVYLSSTTAGLVILFWLSKWLIKSLLRGLDQVETVSKQIAQQDLTDPSVQLPRVSAQVAGINSEAGEVARALNQSLTELERSLREKNITDNKLRQFVADASHELRTPLAVVQGYAQLIEQRNQLSAADTEALQRIISESRRMGKMVQDLLLLARYDAGNQVQKRPVYISPLLIESNSDTHMVDRERSWQVDIPPNLAELQVIGEEDKLRQVFINILRNCSSHTPPGSSILTSLSTREDDRQRWVIIQIDDDGPGIDPDLLPRIFDRFMRADKVRTGESTGLGLSIAKTVVEAHGGKIYAENREDGGASFRIELPALKTNVLDSTPAVG